MAQSRATHDYGSYDEWRSDASEAENPPASCDVPALWVSMATLRPTPAAELCPMQVGLLEPAARAWRVSVVHYPPQPGRGSLPLDEKLVAYTAGPGCLPSTM